MLSAVTGYLVETDRQDGAELSVTIDRPNCRSAQAGWTYESWMEGHMSCIPAPANQNDVKAQEAEMKDERGFPVAKQREATTQHSVRWRKFFLIRRLIVWE